MYKVGDKVRIIRNLTGHGFEMGEIVTVSSLQDDGRINTCESSFDYFFVVDEEVERISNEETN